MGTIALNQYLQPSDAPIIQNQGAVSAYDFFAEHDRSSIMLSKIRNFSFDQAIGGTLTLGGTANGNGVILIKDSSGNIIVQGDSTGLTIYDGKLTFINSTGGTILDSGGIVSSVAFTTGTATNFTTRTTTSTSFTPLTGGSVPSFVLTRPSKVLINVLSQAYNIAWLIDGSSMTMGCIDSIDGTVLSFPHYIEAAVTSVSGTGSPFTGFDYNIDHQVQNVSAFVDMSAGTHSMGLQYKVNGSGTAEVVVTQLGYVILGS